MRLSDNYSHVIFFSQGGLKMEVELPTPSERSQACGSAQTLGILVKVIGDLNSSKESELRIEPHRHDHCSSDPSTLCPRVRTAVC